MEAPVRLPWRLALLIFGTSAAALVFQVAQTRLFSATLGYHLTYLVLSISLLGVGIGSTCSVLVDQRPRRPGLGLLAGALGASALVALFAETHVDPAAGGLWLAIVVAYVLGSLPFVFASWIVVRSLRDDPAHAGGLYAMDLAGAATGSLLAFGGIPGSARRSSSRGRGSTRSCCRPSRWSRSPAGAKC